MGKCVYNRLFPYIVDNGNAGAGGASYALYTGASGGLSFYISDGLRVYLSPDAGTAIWNGSLHFVVGTYDGSTVRLYVDGVQISNGTQVSTSIFYDNSKPFYVGSFQGGFLWDGIIDEVQAYSLALPQSQIQTVYNAGTAGVCKGLTFSPHSLKFSRQTTGTTSPAQTVTAKNSFPLPVAVKKVATSGDFAETNTCPVPPAKLAPGASCTASVTFTPTDAGTRTGKLTFNDSAPISPQRVSLAGAATDISLSVSRLNFGSHKVGTTSKAKTVTVTNDGLVTVNFTGSGIVIAGTDPVDFIISANTCGTSIAAGASCAVSVEFDPSATGSRSATLQFNDDGGESPQNVALLGTGT